MSLNYKTTLIIVAVFGEDYSLNLGLYKGERNDEPVIQIPVTPIPKVTPPVIEPVSIQQKPQPVTHRESPQELKQLSIFDLFENADEPVMVAAPPKRTTQAKRQSTKKRKGTIGRQPDLFSGAMQQPYTPPVTNRATNGKKQEAITLKPYEP